MFLLDNNDDRDRIEWGGATVVFGLLLLVAIGLAVLVNTADFGTGETENPGTRSSTPQTSPSPGPCEPFCLTPRSG